MASQEVVEGIRPDPVAGTPPSRQKDVQDSHSISISTDMIATDSQRSFGAEVLLLDYADTEDQMDDRLREEAKELGLKVSPTSSSAAIPTSTARVSYIEPQRRSGSVDSRTSQSTGLNSTISDVSRIHDRSRRMSKTSFRDYDSFISRGRPNGRLSMSFSPPTTPSHSIFELPLAAPSSSPRKSFLNIKGMSMLKLLRNDVATGTAGGCPHCPRDVISQRRARHDLPCGHRLCTLALRQTILAASANPTGAVASCCGRPIPGSLIEQVMTSEEQSVVLERLEQWDQASSLTPSIKSNMNPPHTRPRPAPGSRTTSTESKVDSAGPSIELVQRKRTLIDLPEYQDLLQQQSDENDRFLAWIERRRSEIRAQLDHLRKEMKTRFEMVMEELHEDHAVAITWAEDKQVKAESDVLEAHDGEKRNNATALKHMEAYCAGTYSDGTPHSRAITSQDLLELEKKREIRDGLDLRHQNAINILRGGQSRRMKLRLERQAKEVQELQRAQRMEELEFERACTAEGVAFEGWKEEKKNRMRGRWEIRGMIMAKKADFLGTNAKNDKRSDAMGQGAHSTRLQDDNADLAATTGAETLSSQAA